MKSLLHGLPLGILFACAALCASACDGDPSSEHKSEALAVAEQPTEQIAETVEPSALRVATFNVSLFGENPGDLQKRLEGSDEQLSALVSIVRLVNPDILILTEFDHDSSGASLAAFADKLDLGYRHRLALSSNTGVRSGEDLDRDGRKDHAIGTRGYAADAYGYGRFPGQYASALLSRFPIDRQHTRTFQEFLWHDLPDNLLPKDYYSKEAQAALRLPSKTFADVPVMIRDHTLHLLIAHPTPPSFDGPEDRNGKRNHDEIRLVTEYISGQKQGWLRDDDGQRGGLARDEAFVIAGDLNADPLDTPAPEQTNRHAIAALIDHPRVTDPQPKSAGGRDAALRQKGRNQTHRGDPALDTSDYYDRTVGNLRADYVLPSSNLTVIDSGVFWPVPGEPGYRWVGRGYPKVSSDHRLVWVDIAWPGAR